MLFTPHGVTINKEKEIFLFLWFADTDGLVMEEGRVQRPWHWPSSPPVLIPERSTYLWFHRGVHYASNISSACCFPASWAIMIPSFPHPLPKYPSLWLILWTTSPSSNAIITPIFCTCHDSTAVLACAKIWSDLITKDGITACGVCQQNMNFKTYIAGKMGPWLTPHTCRAKQVLFRAIAWNPCHNGPEVGWNGIDDGSNAHSLAQFWHGYEFTAFVCLAEIKVHISHIIIT